MAQDQSKREELEQQGEPRRIHKARKDQGEDNFKEIVDVIVQQASNETLNRFGIIKGMTEEKRFGNVKTTKDFSYE